MNAFKKTVIAVAISMVTASLTAGVSGPAMPAAEVAPAGLPAAHDTGRVEHLYSEFQRKSNGALQLAVTTTSWGILDEAQKAQIHTLLADRKYQLNFDGTAEGLINFRLAEIPVEMRRESVINLSQVTNSTFRMLLVNMRLGEQADQYRAVEICDSTQSCVLFDPTIHEIENENVTFRPAANKIDDVSGNSVEIGGGVDKARACILENDPEEVYRARRHSRKGSKILGGADLSIGAIRVNWRCVVQGNKCLVGVGGGVDISNGDPIGLASYKVDCDRQLFASSSAWDDNGFNYKSAVVATGCGYSSILPWVNYDLSTTGAGKTFRLKISNNGTGSEYNGGTYINGCAWSSPN